MKSLRSSLAESYAAPRWAYFEEVRNGTGFSRSVTRSADAMALGLWPSMGLELHGIEIKSSRGDWKRELDNPEKSEELGKFCDRWFLVTEEKVVHDLAEIPPAWGWLEFTGKKLVTRKAAPKRDAVPLDRLFVCSLLRNASEGMGRSINDRANALNERRDEEAEEKRRAAEQASNEKLLKLKQESEQYRRMLQQVEAATGFNWTGYGGTPEVTPEQLETMRLVSGVELAPLRQHLVNAATQLRSASINARSLLRANGIRVPKKWRSW